MYNSGVTDLKLQRGDTMKVIDLTHTGALLPSVTIPQKKCENVHFDGGFLYENGINSRKNIQ